MGIYGHRFDKYRINIHPELVQEGIIDTFKSIIDSIKKAIVNLIDKINGWLDKHPDSKVAQGLKSILTKLKNLLTKADNIKSKEDAEEVKNEVNDIEFDIVDSYIKANDIVALRGILIGKINRDPKFITRHFENTYNYIKNKGISLEEPYVIQSSEKETKEENTVDYFRFLLVQLNNNFALEERLPKIKEVGRIAYKDKRTFGDEELENNII